MIHLGQDRWSHHSYLLTKPVGLSDMSRGLHPIIHAEAFKWPVREGGCGNTLHHKEKRRKYDETNGRLTED